MLKIRSIGAGILGIFSYFVCEDEFGDPYSSPIFRNGEEFLSWHICQAVSVHPFFKVVDGAFDDRSSDLSLVAFFLQTKMIHRSLGIDAAIRFACTWTNSCIY